MRPIMERCGLPIGKLPVVGVGAPKIPWPGGAIAAIGFCDIGEVGGDDSVNEDCGEPIPVGAGPIPPANAPPDDPSGRPPGMLPEAGPPIPTCGGPLMPVNGGRPKLPTEYTRNTKVSCRGAVLNARYRIGTRGNSENKKTVGAS